MPSVKKTNRKSPTKDANGGKLGQFTTEIDKTEKDNYLKGLVTGLKLNKDAFFVGIVIGSALTAMFLSV